eukprot:m.72551 g.72551  ORF g.72551 m.72551 type:complete len:184 (+) comp14420_c1_seq17:53-604(+)
MANHGKAYGLSAELQQKAKEKYDPKLEAEARVWLEQLTGKPINDFVGDLKSGVIICEALNAIKPGSVPKISDSKMPFKMMENIGNFLEGAAKLGVARTDLFQTVDLYEAKNMNQVVDCLHALGRAAQRLGFEGPVIGAKEAEAAPRHFSVDVLKKGETVVPLQAGYTGGASQKGLSFGTTRHM